MTQYSPWGQPIQSQQPGWGQQQSQIWQPQQWGQPTQSFGQARQQWHQPPPFGGAAQPWTQNQPWGQSPPWGAPPQPWPPQRPPRRLGPAMVLLGGAIVIALMILIGSLLTQNGSGSSPTEPPIPGGGYKNEDYRVPPVDLNPPKLPQPKTLSQAKQLVAQNKLYNQQLAQPVRCEVGAVNTQKASPEEQEKQLNSMMECLLRVWGPALESAGWTPVRPSVTVYTSPVQSKCGSTKRRNASYCGADQQIYVSTDLVDVFPSNLRNNRYLIETVLAHEFGHALQGRSAILVSNLVLEDKASTKSERLLLSRRLEQQADCFAGMFLNSIAHSAQMSDNDRKAVAELTHAIGDDVLSKDPDIEGDHGHGENRQRWLETGLSNTKVSMCNTYVVPDSEVR